MVKIGIIGGSGFQSEKVLDGAKQQIVKTMYGNVLLYVDGKTVFLPRHGKNRSIPPHKVNHKANICALNLLGVERIMGVNSVGSLKETIKPGMIVIPDDYINFNPESFFEFEYRCLVPELDKSMRDEIGKAAKKVKIAVKNKATYVQTNGPRLETKAEVKVIKKWGEVVGMTMAKEATLAKELALPYASLCSVDNYANGISKKKLSRTVIEKTQVKTRAKIEKIIKEIVRKVG